jgi:hypothetical protein
MMISDVLSEAVVEIRTYQDRDTGYASLAPAINTVCEVMDALRQYLDSPPAPFLREPLHALQAAIGRLDVSVIRAARHRLAEDWRKGGLAGGPQPEWDRLDGELAPTDATPATARRRTGRRSDLGDRNGQEA